MAGKARLPEAIATDGRQQVLLTFYVNERLDIDIRQCFIYKGVGPIPLVRSSVFSRLLSSAAAVLSHILTLPWQMLVSLPTS